MLVKGRRSGPTDPTGKTRIHQTSRPLGMDTYFTSCSDDITDINKVGESTIDLKIRRSSGESDSKSAYMDLNIANNETWLHEGYMSWKGFNGDKISLEVVTLFPEYEAGTNTNYNLYNGYLIIPAAGDGVINITGNITSPRGGLIYMPDSDEGYPPTAFWNADFNNITGLYENIAAAPTGNGRYNMFGAETLLSRFVNRIGLVGDNSIRLQSSDTARLGQGMRLKLSYYRNTDVDDRDSMIIGLITFHRKRSV